MNERMNLREFDPSNFTLPQQALHRCMFPQAITHVRPLYTGNQLTGSLVKVKTQMKCRRM